MIIHDEDADDGQDWREIGADEVEPDDYGSPEWPEIQAAVAEGLAQVERGEGRPAVEVFARLRVRWSGGGGGAE